MLPQHHPTAAKKESLRREKLQRSKRHRKWIDQILEAPDRAELLDWLRQHPLFHVDAGFAMVHAGLLPHWSIGTILPMAAAVDELAKKGNS